MVIDIDSDMARGLEMVSHTLKTFPNATVFVTSGFSDSQRILQAMRSGDQDWDAMLEMARHGNLASRSDLEVGARLLEVGIWGARRNVHINLAAIRDDALKARTADGADALARRARERCAVVLSLLEQRKD